MASVNPVRTRIVGVAIAGFGLVAIGCAGADTAGSASAGAAQTAALAPTAAPSPSFARQVIEIAAKDREFSSTEMDVAAGSAFQIRFDNQDGYDHTIYIREGVPEDVRIAQRSDPASYRAYAESSLFKGEWFRGPATVTYEVAALPPGSYVFFCTPHSATMVGTLEVK